MPRPLHEPNTRNPTKIPNNHAPPVGAGPIRRAQHPRPLHEPNMRSLTKNNTAVRVGANCVRPVPPP